jgi:CRISPR-associated protein Csm4
MMEAVLLKLRPGSQFHFGMVSPDVNMALQDSDDLPRADTLFSAIITVFAEIFPESTTALVAAFADGRLRISSGGYCLANGERRRFFLPAPAHWRSMLPDKNSRFAAIRFISQKAWENGATPDRLYSAVEAAQYVVLQQQFLLHRSELTGSELAAVSAIRLFRKDTVPKVKVHSVERSESLFFRTMLQIADNSALCDRKNAPLTPDLRVHFYFLQEVDEVFAQTELFEQYRCALEVLADTGLGGERHTGCGGLTGVTTIPFAWQRQPETGRYINLGLFSPRDEAALRACTAYYTEVRGGRTTAQDGQIRFVRMLSEGALANATPDGAIHDLRISDRLPYLRYGRGFWVPSPF